MCRPSLCVCLCVRARASMCVCLKLSLSLLSSSKSLSLLSPYSSFVSAVFGVLSWCFAAQAFFALPVQVRLSILWMTFLVILFPFFLFFLSIRLIVRLVDTVADYIVGVCFVSWSAVGVEVRDRWRCFYFPFFLQILLLLVSFLI